MVGNSPPGPNILHTNEESALKGQKMADLVAKRWTDEGDVGQGEPDPVGAPDQAD